MRDQLVTDVGQSCFAVHAHGRVAACSSEWRVEAEIVVKAGVIIAVVAIVTTAFGVVTVVFVVSVKLRCGHRVEFLGTCVADDFANQFGQVDQVRAVFRGFLYGVCECVCVCVCVCV